MRLLILLAILALSGCGTMDAYRSVAADRGADAADQALDTAIWGQCQMSTLGAFSRRYPTEQERIAELARCDKEASR